MIEKTVTFREYSVSVREATGLDDMHRQILRMAAFKPDDKNPKLLSSVETDEARQMMRLVSYPDYTSCLVKSEGLPDPLTFEAFIMLPGQFLDQWGKAVYELNPYWLDLPESENDQKKALKSGGELSNL